MGSNTMYYPPLLFALLKLGSEASVALGGARPDGQCTLADLFVHDLCAKGCARNTFEYQYQQSTADL
jgi:hypothetical protein